MKFTVVVDGKCIDVPSSSRRPLYRTVTLYTPASNIIGLSLSSASVKFNTPSVRFFVKVYTTLPDEFVMLIVTFPAGVPTSLVTLTSIVSLLR